MVEWIAVMQSAFDFCLGEPAMLITAAHCKARQ